MGRSADGTELGKNGFTVVLFGQDFRDISPTTKKLMKLVLEQNIARDGNVPLRWMMDNVYTIIDPAGNIKMDKKSPQNE